MYIRVIMQSQQVIIKLSLLQNENSFNTNYHGTVCCQGSDLLCPCHYWVWLNFTSGGVRFVTNRSTKITTILNNARQ